MRSPSIENAHVRALELVSMVLTVLPVAQSHKRAELSADAVSKRVESTKRIKEWLDKKFK